jgi:hypothetical protein
MSPTRSEAILCGAYGERAAIVHRSRLRAALDPAMELPCGGSTVGGDA